jgi:threonine/homoserine/homoserine lactone efflux protein
LALPTLGILHGLAAGIILGFSIAAPPGPINATIASRIALKGSWWVGFVIGVGAMTADALFLALTYLGYAEVLSRSKWMVPWTYLVGGLVLLFYAGLILLRSRNVLTPTEGKGESVRGRIATEGKNSYFVGLSMGVTNPYQIAWWMTVGIATISSFGPLVVFGFFSGIIVENLIYTKILEAGFARVRRFRRIVVSISAIVLVVFGAWFLYLALLG